MGSKDFLMSYLKRANIQFIQKIILIIGSGGFFGNSILDYLNKKKILKKKINKIILVSRSKKNQIPLGLKKNYKVIQIKKDISKAKRIIFADYVIYCAISKNYADDYKSVKNYFRLAKKYHKNRFSFFYSRN